MDKKYYSQALRVSAISIVVNFVIALVKFIIGAVSNSISILSDAAHSLADLITTVIVIFSLRLSRKPPDKDHPFGHGRAEDIGGLFLSFVLVVVGFRFFRDSVARLFLPQEVRVNYLFLGLILLTALVKLVLGLFTKRVATKISSPLLATDAFHHYSDFFTSLAVAGGIFWIRKGYVHIDSLLGAGIAVIIILWAITAGKNFADRLLGKKESPHLYAKIEEIALGIDFVQGVHDVEIHSYGKSRIISLHVEVNSNLSLPQAHEVADRIEKELHRERLGRGVVHIDLTKGGLRRGQRGLERAMNRLVTEVKGVRGFHGINVITTEGATTLNFHLLLDKGTSLEASHALSHRLSASLKKKFNFSQVNIHIEPF